MPNSEVERIQGLLSADASAFRAELAALGFDALAALPVAHWVAADELVTLITEALAESAAGPFARELVLPAIKRVTADLAQRSELVGDALSDAGKAQLRAVVEAGRGPKFAWLSGAIAPDDMQKLVGPIVQDVLLKFVAKMPLPGASGSAGSGGSSGISGLVGLLGKQVQKSAGQLADVGKSVLGGLGGELERRISATARDFSHAAASDVRKAVVTRLRSDEGKRIVLRMRDSVVERILGAKLSDVTSDLLRLPVDDIGEIVIDTLDHLRGQAFFTALVSAEVRASITALGTRSAHDVLESAGLLARVKTLAIHAVDPGLQTLSASPAFGDWLTRLLDASRAP